MLTRSKLVLSVALILGTVSAAAAESWDPVPGDRNPNPIGGQMLLESRGAYDARMHVPHKGRAEITPVPQFGVPAQHDGPLGPVSSPSIYGGGF